MGTENMGSRFPRQPCSESALSVLGSGVVVIYQLNVQKK